MWYHEVEALLNDGKPVKRLTWPKEDSLRVLTESVDLSEFDMKQMNIPSSLNADIPKGVLVYCTKKTASIGYILTSEDKQSQDWEAA